MPKPKYPHMLPGDIAIWERFMDHHGSEYARFDYDLHVGEGMVQDPDWPENIIRMVEAISQKRIDAVGYNDDGIYIFEVKPFAALSALGQVLSYRALYTRDSNPVVDVVPCVVTDRVDPDVTWLYQHFGITLYLV